MVMKGSWTEQRAPLSKASRSIQCFVLRVFRELFITMPLGAGISLPNFNPDEQEAVVISLARANDQGHTTAVFCLAESGPFRLRNQNNRYIWSNHELRENDIDVRSIITYQRFDQCCLYSANTRKKVVSLALQFVLIPLYHFHFGVTASLFILAY